MHNCHIQVMTKPDENKVMIFIDPKSDIRVVVPMTPDASAKVAQALGGVGILVPQFVPPKDLSKKNGS